MRSRPLINPMTKALSSQFSELLCYFLGMVKGFNTFMLGPMLSASGTLIENKLYEPQNLEA